MSIKEKPLLDKRVKMIYDRYRTGRSITLNDLQYLWLKDPESCSKLVSSIAEPKSVKGIRLKLNHKASNGYVEKNKESKENQKNYIEYISSSDTPMVSLTDIRETMFSVKSMIENMSESERMELLNNVNDESVLKRVTNKMKYWDDAFIFKMVSYSYVDEKEFNKLA